MSSLPRQIQRWQDSESTFIAEALKIRDKQQRVVGLYGPEFPAQREVSDIVEGLKEAGRPVRIIGLKPRQVGLTTIFAAHVYQRTSLFPNVLSLIVSMDLESAQAIHEKNDFFWETSPAGVRPMRARASRREMVFDNPRRVSRLKMPGLRSRIYCETAAKVSIGRSSTLHNFHGSEVAYWKDGAERGLAAMNAVPEEPGTMIVLESTANGVGDYFHDRWQSAKRIGSAWTPYFFPWNRHPQYQRPQDTLYNAVDLSDEEVKLVEEFSLTPEQVTWRRYAIAEKCNGDTEQFRQEFPLTDEEAFITSGRPAFNRDHVLAMRAGCRDSDFIVLDPVRGPRGLLVRASKQRHSLLRVWEAPRKHHLYVIGADCALGIEGGDYQAAEVVDAHTNEQVASYHSHEEPGKYAEQLDLLGRFYNDAILAIEKNGDGINVLSRLLQRSYPNLYVHEELDLEKVKQGQRKYGWLMSDQSKRLVMAELQNALRTRMLKIREAELLDEMLWMQRDKFGRFAAPKGKHDDRIVAIGIAWFIARQEAVQRLQADELPWADPILMHQPLAEREKQYKRERERDVPYWAD